MTHQTASECAATMRWLGLSEQLNALVKWSLCGFMPRRGAAG
jgi:hypothetical protein